MITQHQPADAMRRLDIRRLLGERDLDRRRAPGDELSESALPNPQQALVHVRGVDVVALDDVEDGDVTGRFGRGDGDHGALGLEEAAHDV